MGLPPLNVLLIRHGLTDWNEEGRLLGRSDIGLNPRGRRQIETLADGLSGVRWEAIASSPQRRARETASVIAGRSGIPVGTEEGIDEVWLGDRWQGKLMSEVRTDPELHEYLKDPLYVCDAIEPIVDVQTRMIRAMEGLRLGGVAGNVGLVSHGDPIRVAVAHYLSMKIRDYRRLVVENGSVSVVRFGRRGPRVVALNWTPRPVPMETAGGV